MKETAVSDSSFRLGGLSYLNTRPLVYGLEPLVTPGEPAQMAERMRRGEFDAAIVPLAEVLEHNRYDVVDGIAIASRGPVRSVFLAHRVPLGFLRRIAVTPASRTSVWLLRVLLKQLWRIEPEFYPKPAGGLLCDHEAMLLIGDEALEYAQRKPSPHRAIWDLGAAWTGWTGLPFVFAVWAVRHGAKGTTELCELLRHAKRQGLAHLEEIAVKPGPGTPEFRREYLTENVGFDLGAEEKRGLRRFQELCHQMGLVKEAHVLRFVS